MDSVITTADAIARFGASATRHRVRARRWQQPRRGVVVLHNGPLSELENLQCLVLSAPTGAALAGPTALRLEGFSGFDENRPHLVIPRGSRARSIEGAKVHWTRVLSEQDIRPLRSPRRTTVARSLVDYASWSRSDRQARAIVIAGLQQGLSNAQRVREVLARRGPCRRRALIGESVLDALGGIDSLPERDFDWIRSVVGLPPPQRQRRVQRRDGRYYLDAWFEEFDLAVEIHGIPHLAVGRWDNDLQRANELVIAGERVLTFSSFAVRHAQWEVAEQLQRMARHCGWRGAGVGRPTFEALQEQNRRTFRPLGQR